MKRVAAVVVLVGCSSAPARPPVAPVVLPAASTVCYAGVSTGMGQTARTIARRTVDPAAQQIVEDVSHDDAGAHGAKSFHVVMTVDGDQFTMVETGGAFSGNGALVGERWQWTSWTSTAKIPNTTIEVVSDDEVTPTSLKSTKQIRKDGSVVAKTVEELKPFDCTDWDKVKATLASPPADDAACERACRNYATLKFWQMAEPVIAAVPPAERDEARKHKAEELAGKLEAGVPGCVTDCVSAHNGGQTACLGAAKTVEQLPGCLDQ